MRTELLTSFFTFFVLASSVSAQPETRKFYEAKLDDITCDDAKAHLDNLAIELRNHPAAKAYIIFYGGRKIRRRLPRRGEDAARISYWKAYLDNTGRIEPSRIEVINGGYREDLTGEIWIVPAGAKRPSPTPTVRQREIRFRRGKIKRIEICGES